MQVLAGPASVRDVRNYLGLNVDGAPPLAELYRRWSVACSRLAQVAFCVPGLRVLQQEPLETIFGFICSSNNNVSRIALLLDRLCVELGEKICELPPSVDAVDDNAFSEGYVPRQLTYLEEFNSRKCLYSFPRLEALALAPEKKLRKLGLGYRAPFIRGSANALLAAGGMEYVKELKLCGRAETKEKLCLLPGVGPKVADCIALFAFGHHSCIPVDVHVWRIATRDYDTALRDAKSLTPAVYERVGDAFRERFGDYAGWAHSLLFGAELAGSEAHARLPRALLDEMERFREEERSLAAQRRLAKKRPASDEIPKKKPAAFARKLVKGT